MDKVKNKMMSLKPELLDELRSYKVHHRESDSECLGRIIDEYKTSTGKGTVNTEEVAVPEHEDIEIEEQE